MAEDLRLVRPFTLDIGDPTEPNWASLRKASTIKFLQGVSFGFAEEIIGFAEYVDGVFLVGIGESLRPFNELYRGESAEEASDIFFRAVIERAYSTGVQDE